MVCEMSLAVKVVKSTKVRIFLYQCFPLFRSFHNILEFCSGLLKGVLKLGFPVGRSGDLSSFAD